MGLPKEVVGRWLVRYLSRQRATTQMATSPPELVASTLKKGDVLLIDGTTRFGNLIKHFTRSTWSHMALYIGNALGLHRGPGDAPVLVEADINAGGARRSTQRVLTLTHSHLSSYRPVARGNRRRGRVRDRANRTLL